MNQIKPTLVVLAAGIGSRYGGIKQLDGFGPNNEKIIDYTIFDALDAGFGKIVFVIRRDIEKDFDASVVHAWDSKIEIVKVFQELDSLPHGMTVPDGRTKPWGTAHAVWMSQRVVNAPFAIVNADDFYGRDALKKASLALNIMDNSKEQAFLIGYQLGNTLTDNGSVSRGICSVHEGFLSSIEEKTKIFKHQNKIVYEENGQLTEVDKTVVVSMNLMGFTTAVFEEIESGFSEIYNQSSQNLKVEYYIPTILAKWVAKGVKVPVITTDSKWYGVTYQEDKPMVKSGLADLHRNNVYPQQLWTR